MHLRGPNRSRKVESKPTAIRKIIPLCLAPSRPPQLFHLLICISSHSSAGLIWLSLAEVRAPEVPWRVSWLVGKGDRSRAEVRRDRAPLRLSRWQLPPPPTPPGPLSKPISGILTDFGSWLPMQEGFHGNVPLLLTPSSAVCLPFPPSLFPHPPPQPSCFSSLLPWKSHNPQRISDPPLLLVGFF